MSGKTGSRIEALYREALQARPDRIMLDELTPAELRSAIAERLPGIELELSGGVLRERLAAADYPWLPGVGGVPLASASVFDLGVYLVVVGATMVMLLSIARLSRAGADATGGAR